MRRTSCAASPLGAERWNQPAANISADSNQGTSLLGVKWLKEFAESDGQMAIIPVDERGGAGFGMAATPSNWRHAKVHGRYIANKHFTQL